MNLNNLFILAILLLASVICNAQNTKTTFKANPSLTTALGYVDTDGEALSVSNDKEFLEDLAKSYDTLLTPIFQMNESTQRLNFNDLLSVFGMNGITSTASSSKKYQGHYINKYFIQTSSQNKGIWSFWGRADKATVAENFAPEDTNLLLETQLNSQQLYGMLLETLKMVNPEVAEESVRNFGIQIPELNMTGKELLAKINSRISIVSTIDFKASLVDISKPPKYKATARIDGVAVLLWPGIQPELAKIGKIESDGNQHSIELPNIETEVGPLVFTLHFDLDNDYVWITTDKVHLKTCRDAKAPKLATNKQFIAAMQNLPKTGCAQLYISRDLSNDIVVTSANALDFAGKQDPIPSIQKLTRELQPMIKNSQGISWKVEKNNDGILFASNTPFRIRGGVVQYMTLTATLSSIATPLVLSKRKEADKTKNVIHMKQLLIAVIDYEQENGKLPKNLEDLIKANPGLNKVIMMKTDQGEKPVVYIFQKKPKNNDIMMHTPASIGDKHVILKHDGSVHVIPSEDLDPLLKK